MGGNAVPARDGRIAARKQGGAARRRKDRATRKARSADTQEGGSGLAETRSRCARTRSIEPAESKEPTRGKQDELDPAESKQSRHAESEEIGSREARRDKKSRTRTASGAGPAETAIPNTQNENAGIWHVKRRTTSPCRRRTAARR